jgi:succinate dehydrogenase cytochrome b556 subunit
MATLVTTVTETLRYRGKIGQWSWVLHRIAGLGTLLFLGIHVVDTSWAAFYPELYQEAIKQYQNPLFTVGEFVLVACLIYHAFNGLRIIVLDWRPEWWAYQQQAATLVFGATIVVLVPTFAIMFSHTLDFHNDDPEFASLDAIIRTQSEFVAGFAIVIVAALLLSALYGVITRSDSGFRLPGRAEAMMWSFMRLSGILIIPLVFGHLGMIHLIQGVFDITGGGLEVVGTDAVNQSGHAVEFVGERWDMLVAGVAVWRVYDGLLLALALVHGFNGLRYVVNDYTHRPVVNRALNWAILFGMVALIVLGVAALLEGVDETAYDIANDMTFK